jgi:hypothetical protein
MPFRSYTTNLKPLAAVTRLPLVCATGLLLLALANPAARAQTTPPAETHHYSIEIAGIRVGTMTAVRQPMTANRTTYTLISDVKVKLLVYTVTVYYKVINEFVGKKLMRSTVDAHTNKGNYSSKTEWQGDRYSITANQYKYQHQATETAPIDFTISSLYFAEPVGRSRIYAEYFGDYFTFTPTGPGTYKATLDDRQDDYVYEKGVLTKVVKHNSLKNFIIKRLD